VRRKPILALGVIARARCSSVKGLSTMVAYFILAVILVSLFIFPLTKVSAESSIMWDKTYGGTELDRGRLWLLLRTEDTH